jgi:DNA-binding response OmpR family regulator
MEGVRTIEAMSGVEVVVVEDDDGIGASLRRTLAGQGYGVTWARTAGEAADVISADTDIVILDLGLPDGDGLELCRALRDRSPAPQVLIVTARDGEADVVLGLDAGADDYLVKPFRLAELLARVRACARRADGDRDRIAIGDLTIDVGARTVAIGDDAVELRPKEFDLLAALAFDAGRVVSRDRLLREVWDEHWFGSTKTLDIHIWALRRKLDPVDGPSRIATVRGVGYRLESP